MFEEEVFTASNNIAHMEFLLPILRVSLIINAASSLLRDVTLETSTRFDESQEIIVLQDLVDEF